MAAVRERHDPVRLMWRRLLLIGLFLFVLSAAWAVWGIWGKERESAALDSQAQGQLADLEARQAKLQSDYAALETDRGKEAALRQEYGVGKQGENLIVIVEPDKPVPVQATSSMMQWLKDVFSHL